MPETTSREVRLASRPVGFPAPENFALVTTAVPDPGPGQVLVRNTWMSVDPHLRAPVGGAPSHLPPLRPGEPPAGDAVGRVVASASPDVPVGATVAHHLGWREHAVLDAAAVTAVDTAVAPEQAYLGVLGTPGLTAYVALTETAPVRPGDVVFVSAAAGAVGSVAGQVAARLGASRVIGSAGGPVKVGKLLDDLGYDAGLDHHAGGIAARLAEAAPDGVDVYLDLVGGYQLQVAIGALREGGRVALVGAISEYGATGPVPGPTNLHEAARKQLTLRGLLVTAHRHRFPEYRSRATTWLATGLRTEETVYEGLERAPEAFLAVLRGLNTGKVLVRLER
ncbi:NADP-dependent oxidoreductase [Saccharothrix syringae]|uniref:NADP-dependent oxidoreductase n=1 Tax=Saccharothrix syringae TaxID=103733 RepID=A0A5Q0H6I7_SACSY|nr:NADP-dependent oxidoreductase [Saccharothrix syringae]QFZ21332.1 NADP-dependent oxidoreductase [Saccharothrix syringae]